MRWLGILSALLALFSLTACARLDSSTSGLAIQEELDRGQHALAAGQPGAAHVLFSQALETALRTGNDALQVDARIAVAESERELGDLSAALSQLHRALEIAEKRMPDSERRAALEIALGGVELASGRAESAQARLEAGSLRAKNAGLVELEAAAQLELGNLFALKGESERALLNYRRSAELAILAQIPAPAAQALTNAARLELGDGETSRSLLARAAAMTSDLPNTHLRASLLVSLGERTAELAAGGSEGREELRASAATLLLEALATANAIGDHRAASYALGFLGGLYEEAGRQADALDVTRRAAARAARGNAPESLYRWQAQRGRLLTHQGKFPEAIAAYQRSVDLLQSLRHREPWGAGLQSSSFQSHAVPVYYALTDLLLQQASRRIEVDGGNAGEQELLRRARDTVEELRAAELRDYFQDDCVDALRAKLAGLESVSASALVIYPIPLPDRLVVLVGLPSGRLEQHSVPIGRAQVENEALALRRRLEERTNRRYLAHSRTLYDWLLRPMEAHLNANGVDTLVFVPDGALLTIPMAALHDGERFLVERFALALTPGLELTDPRSIDPNRIRTLLGGVSEGVRGFAPLPNVVAEVKSVGDLIPSRILLDAEFRRDALRDALAGESYGLVHLATHAEFSSQGEGAFLLAWDGSISLDELAADIGLFRFRDEPLELLTLSACETAQGDERAALGLSGIAIKAGARSAVGTLWSVNDPAASALVRNFYHALLIEGASRAGALRQAQRRLLAQRRYRHPAYWAPFILIGSWL